MDIVIFLAMIFAHIFADFKFQGDFMATYKQKSNWVEYVSASNVYIGDDGTP